MGRRRKDDSQGLPHRVYLRSGSFYYVHASTGKWEKLGRDLASACKRADHYNDPTGTYGTMSWYLDQFLIDCEQRATAKSLSPRTVEDYRTALVPLKAFFGAMLPSEIGAHHIAEYLDIGLRAGRPVRANRERACMSSCISWMLRSNVGGGLKVNPCMRASGVRRNPESQRERYVTDKEYQAVHLVAPNQVRLMMELVYRTLQRPEVDVLSWTPANVRIKGGGKVLHFRQNKSGRLIDIALTDKLGTLIQSAIGDVPPLRQPIVHTLAGDRYSYHGISAMLKRAQAKAQVESFGFRDLKGKGATDMWLAGEPIERIQMLCGHANKATTERYIKARWRETAEPNKREITS
jgi:integrase